MMTSSNGNIFRVTGHRWISRTRPVTRSFDVFVHLWLNKRFSKQSWDWWFETPSCSLWSYCNDKIWQTASHLCPLSGSFCVDPLRKQKLYGNIHVYHISILKWYKNTKFFPLEYKNIVNNMATNDLAMRSHSFGVHGIGKVRPECSGLRHGRFNSLGPSGTIWRRISGLTLALVMFFTDRTKPSPLPMLAIRVIPWQSLENNFTANAKAVYRV